MVISEAILVIVLIGAAMVVLNTVKRRGATADADALRDRDEVRRLRERVQTLERVITDTHGSSALDTEIERLRDPQER